MAKNDKFSNKIVGEVVTDFSLSVSGKSFEAPNQDVSLAHLKAGNTGIHAMKIDSDDKFDNTPRGHDRA